jgi:hypothetical protein
MRFPILFLTLILAHDAPAQSNRGPLRVFDRNTPEPSVDDSAQKIQAARASGHAESTRVIAEQAVSAKSQKELAAKAAEAAKALLREPDPAEAARSRQTDRALDEAKTNASATGKILLAQSSKAAPTSAPAAPAAAEGDPKPMPMKPVSLEDPTDKGKDRIVITSDALYFDSNGSIAIFVGNVKVKHPQFFLTCHEMEVHTKKEEPAKEGAKADAKGAKSDTPPAVSNPVVAVDAAPAKEDSGIKMAIAKGPMVVIEKLTESGDVQVGVCKHATYIGATEEIIMRDYPQVQRGNMVDKATDPSTKMILKPNGEYKREGPGAVDIIQEDKKRKPTNLVPLPSQQPNAAPRAPASGNGGAINLPPPAGL